MKLMFGSQTNALITLNEKPFVIYFCTKLNPFFFNSFSGSNNILIQPYDYYINMKILHLQIILL